MQGSIPTLILILTDLLLAAGPTSRPAYPIHHDITATELWVGEPAAERRDPGNLASAWDEHWPAHFGGFDDPKNRSGWNPKAFVPKENPFYFALPYNDLDKDGRKSGAAGVI